MVLFRKLIASSLSLILIATVVGCQKASTESTSSLNDVVTGETVSNPKKTTKLSFNGNKWNYDEDNDVFWQTGVNYCQYPLSDGCEKLMICIPGKYMEADENDTGTFACSVDIDNCIGSYSAKSAPIILKVNDDAFAGQTVPEEYSYDDVDEYISQGYICVFAGFVGTNNSFNAPWGITELKAIVRYLRYNCALIPGDFDRIFAIGSGEGASLCSVLGASADSSLYYDYLKEIGAAMLDSNGVYISDDICGVVASSPEPSPDTANEISGWLQSQTATQTTSASAQGNNDGSWSNAMSYDLGVNYVDYINAIGLGDSIDQYSLNNVSEGTYYDYVLGEVNVAIPNTYSSIASFVSSIPNQDVYQFDSLDADSSMNHLFGNGQDGMHFDLNMADVLTDNEDRYQGFADYNPAVLNEFELDLAYEDLLGNTCEMRQNLMNPMYFICDYYGYEGVSTAARYWKIDSAINESPVAFVSAVNLELALSSDNSVDNYVFNPTWTVEGNADMANNDSATIEWINSMLAQEPVITDNE